MKKPIALWFLIIAGLALATPLVIFRTSAAQKMKPEEVVEKHLASVGAEETRASIKNRIAGGPVVFTLSAPRIAKFNGQTIMASEGVKNMIAMIFDSSGTAQEKVVFDGSKVTVASPRPGSRGFWGDFLTTHDNIVKLGLVGGALSEAWPLYNWSEKKGALKYSGTRKSDGRTLQELEFVPKGSSDLKIILLFDSETFQHVRSEYTRVISAGLGSASTTPSGVAAGAIDGSGQQRPTRYKMTEEFSDFKKEGGLSLPHNYKIRLELDTRGGMQIVDWDVTLTEFAFNQPIPPATFNSKAN